MPGTRPIMVYKIQLRKRSSHLRHMSFIIKGLIQILLPLHNIFNLHHRTDDAPVVDDT